MPYPYTRCTPLAQCMHFTSVSLCRVPIAQAIGRICAELLCPYPPGVPLLFPGEVVQAGAVAQLLAALEQGGYVTGASDASLETILVVEA